MHQIDNAYAVASAPTVPAPGTKGWFTEGNPPVTPPTPVPDWWLNMVQAELVAILTMAGVAQDKADNGQIADILRGALALVAHDTDTGFDTTTETRALVAATNSKASGADSAVVASEGLQATGVRSFVAACYTTGPSSVSGTSSAALASDGGANGLAIAGARSFVAACDGGTNGLVILGDNCVALGSENLTADGDHNVALGCDAVDFDGASNNNTALSSTGVYGTDTFENSVQYGFLAACIQSVMKSSSTVAAMIATRTCEVDLAHATLTTEAGVLVASRNARLADPYTLALGYSGSALAGTGNENLAIKFVAYDGTTVGNGYFDGGADVAAADYAELFENADGVGEIPVGCIVAFEGPRARLAEGPDDFVAGSVSAAPGVVGNSASLGWRGRYMVDDFGRPVVEEVEHVRIRTAEGKTPIFDGRVDEAPDELLALAADGDLLYESYTLTERVCDPSYDPSREYVPRRERRDEWTTVALLGQVPVRIGEDVADGAALTPGPGGLGYAVTSSRPAAQGKQFRVMETIKPYDAADGYGVAMCYVWG